MKRKKLKGFVSLLLAGSMLLLTCACGENSDEETPQTNEENEGEEQNEESDDGEGTEETSYDPFGKYEEPITISIVREVDPNVKFDSSKDGYKSIEDNVWIDAYRDMLGINVEYMWTTANDAYVSKWNAAIASGDIPDAAVVTPDIYQQLLEGGYVEDMTDYFEQYASDDYKEANEGDGGIAEECITVDGRMMGLPHTGATPDASSLLFIRRDWLEQLDLPVPTTIDELVDTARKFKEAKLGGENTVGLVISNGMITGQCDIGGFLNGYGVLPNIWVEQEDGTLGFGNVQPEMKDALQKLQEMYAEGLIQQDFAVQDATQAAQLIASGQAGIMYGTSWAPLGVMMDSITGDETADWMALESVTTDGTPFITQGSATPAYRVFVKKGIEHPEAVVKMMNLNFKLLDEEPKVYGTTEDGLDANWYRFAFFTNKPWANLDNYKIVNEAVETGDTTAVEEKNLTDMYNIIKTYSDNPEDVERADMPTVLTFGPESTYAIIGKLWDEGRIYTDKFLSTYSEFAQQNITDLNEVLWSEYVKIIMGEDIDNFEKAVEVWNTNGGERITQEVNEWYSSR